MKIKIAATTDPGKIRSNNEDAYIICPNLLNQNWSIDDTKSYIPMGIYGSVIVVADGMGGTNSGEVASSIATKSVKEFFSKETIKQVHDTEGIKELLKLCMKYADEAINRYIINNPETTGMGTTIVICWIINHQAHIAWCGDSRCYVYNPYYGIKQLTKDHSLVQDLVDKGEITEEEAFKHPDSNIITRGLGDIDSLTIPDIISYSITPNDTFLLCSDGLCGYCSNKEIESVMYSNYPNILKCRSELLKLALNAGGYDNICLVLISVISNKQDAPSKISLMRRVINLLKRSVS